MDAPNDPQRDRREVAREEIMTVWLLILLFVASFLAAKPWVRRVR